MAQVLFRRPRTRKGEPRAERPSTSKTDDNVERVRSLVRSDHRLTLGMISSELNLNWFTVHQVLTQVLDMRKMVPKNLTTEEKANRRDVCLDLLDCLEREPEFFNRVITGDESWNLEYDPKTKCQSWEWHTANYPRPKKARMSKSKIKSMLICFFESGDRPQGICATRTNCKSNFLSGSPWKTQEKVARVRPGIAHTWMLHHDNAPCHTAVSINAFLA